MNDRKVSSDLLTYIKIVRMFSHIREGRSQHVTFSTVSDIIQRRNFGFKISNSAFLDAAMNILSHTLYMVIHV